jgi:hypothetical protein
MFLVHFIFVIAMAAAMNITQIKEIVGIALDKCEEFQKYSDQDTITILFKEKIHTIADVQHYIFRDSLILSCLTHDEFTSIAVC